MSPRVGWVLWSYYLTRLCISSHAVTQRNKEFSLEGYWGERQNLIPWKHHLYWRSSKNQSKHIYSLLFIGPLKTKLMPIPRVSTNSELCKSWESKPNKSQDVLVKSLDIKGLRNHQLNTAVASLSPGWPPLILSFLGYEHCSPLRAGVYCSAPLKLGWLVTFLTKSDTMPYP